MISTLRSAVGVYLIISATLKAYDPREILRMLGELGVGYDLGNGLVIILCVCECVLGIVLIAHRSLGPHRAAGGLFSIFLVAQLTLQAESCGCHGPWSMPPIAEGLTSLACAVICWWPGKRRLLLNDLKNRAFATVAITLVLCGLGGAQIARTWKALADKVESHDLILHALSSSDPDSSWIVVATSLSCESCVVQLIPWAARRAVDDPGLTGCWVIVGPQDVERARRLLPKSVKIGVVSPSSLRVILANDPFRLYSVADGSVRRI